MTLDFGWGDPIESSIVLAYRRKGEQREHEFQGPVGVLGEDRRSITWLQREELPLDGDRLDLTKVPVIGIGGKRKHQPTRARQFLEENSSFQGALLLYPGSGNWDLGEGMLIVTSHEALSGRRISGGRPKEQLTNYRWLRDDRYVADRAKMLHGKVLETLEAEVEQQPGAELIADQLLGRGSVDHPLKEELRATVADLRELESRCVRLTDEQARDMTALVRERLVEKFREADVRYVRDIPGNLSVTAEEIAPELVSERNTLGTVDVPGLGRRLPKKQLAGFGFGDQVPAVELSIEEFRQLESWPFAKVYPVLTELGNTRDQLDYDLRDAIEAPEAERAGKLREFFSRRWLEAQRSSNRPRGEEVTDPREADPPATPGPVVWGFDLMTGEELLAYAALTHDVREVKGSIVDSGWFIRWFDDAEKAAQADAEARREAESYITARRLEAELTTEPEAAELPVSLPEAPSLSRPTPEDILARAGFSESQYRIREDVGYWSWTSGGVTVESNDGMRKSRLPISRHAALARLADDEVWEIGMTGLSSHLFEGLRVPVEDGHAFARPVLAEMGLAEKEVETLRAAIESEHLQALDEYAAQVQQFVKTLQAQPAYASLSPDMREKLAGTPNISRIENKLREEWAKAEALQRRAESGEILTDFGGHFRRMGATGQRDYWVVTPDGGRRKPDEVQYRKRYTSEGEKRWRVVGPDELALYYHKADSADNHHCEVVKVPVSGLTAAQRHEAAVIENELGALQGAFGLDPEAAAQQERRLAGIREACGLSPVLRTVPELDILAVCGKQGQEVPDEHLTGHAGKFVYQSAEFGERCASREAQLVYSQPAGEGVLEFLTYYKWGQWNLNIRWRPRRDDEDDPVDSSEEEVDDPVDPREAAERLKAYFSR